MLLRLLGAACAATALTSVAATWQPERPLNYDEGKVGPYALEDPLTFVDGHRVSVRLDWAARRQEILGIFEREMYGRTPPKPEGLVFELADEKIAVAGFALRRQYRMWFKADRSGPCVNWIVWTPRQAKKPVPVILFLNYCGNHELVRDPDIPVTGAWLRNQKGHVENHRAVEAGRGCWQDSDSDDTLPLQVILARGYAVMSACYAEVSPDPTRDDPEFGQDDFAYTGVFSLWGRRDGARTDNTTAIGAWAWALSRGLDLAERIPGLAPERSVVTGYSRLGKAALLAGSRDDRFAVCVPVQTGGGGAPLAKRDYGESVCTMTYSFRHWYCRAYDKYRMDPAATMPFDQHLLLASIAPRALLVLGFGKPWFDTHGEFLACKAASAAWRFLGDSGLPDVEWPEPYETTAIGRTLGYAHRTEGHGMSGQDWVWLLDFADRQWKNP